MVEERGTGTGGREEQEVVLGRGGVFLFRLPSTLREDLHKHTHTTNTQINKCTYTQTHKQTMYAHTRYFNIHFKC